MGLQYITNNFIILEGVRRMYMEKRLVPVSLSIHGLV